MSPDWSAKEEPVPYAKLDNPQSLNLYSYVYNNPLSRADADGHWPTEIHEQIIDKAFPGLTEKQRSIIKAWSANMDHCFTCQLESTAYQHSMRAPGEDIAKAKNDTAKFISDKEGEARNAQGFQAKSLDQITPGSLGRFGEGGHTVMDGTSPAHVDAQGNPLEWNPYSISGVQAHEAAEATISPAQMDTAVGALRQAFANVYGADIARQAATAPQATPSPAPAATHCNSRGCSP